MSENQMSAEEVNEAIRSGAKVSFPLPQEEQPHPQYGFGEPLPDAEDVPEGGGQPEPVAAPPASETIVPVSPAPFARKR